MDTLLQQIDAAIAESNPRAAIAKLGECLKTLVMELSGSPPAESSDHQAQGQGGGEGTE